jgi:hypothetical protein
MFPKSGRKFPNSRPRPSPEDYAVAIGAALRRELGTAGGAAKTIMKWTGASDRSARNWLNGLGGPTGWHLILLARESSEVMEAVLAMTNRDGLMLGSDIRAIRIALIKVTAAIDDLMDGAP